MKAHLGKTIAWTATGVLVARAAVGAHAYGPPAQVSALPGLASHPVLAAVAHVVFLGLVLVVGAVIVAALVKPPAE